MDFGLGLGLGIVIGLFMAGGLFVLLEMMERPKPTTSTQPSGYWTTWAVCSCGEYAPMNKAPWRLHWGMCPQGASINWHWIIQEPSGAGDTSTPEGG